MENKWDLTRTASAKGRSTGTLLERYKELLIESTRADGEARPSHGEGSTCSTCASCATVVFRSAREGLCDPCV